MRALVTAGGTSEPIDDVRVVTNLSTGRFGAALAGALVARGVEVALLAGPALVSRPEWVDPRARVVPFRTFRDLSDALAVEIDGHPPDLVLMAAAVSDYSPIPADGKLSSDQDELVIRMRRNPKLLASLRERCGPATTLVGFKLLSHVTDDELVAVARRQVASGRLDFCVANDLRDLAGGRQPVRLVSADGRVEALDGTKTAVAQALVERLLPTLRPPAPTDRIAGASIALVDRAGRRVLLGRRLRPPHAGAWAFPGGRCEPGEDPLAAALRELREETGLVLGPVAPWFEETVFVDGPTRFEVRCFVVPCDQAPEPRDTDELEARWVALDAIGALSPLTDGARRVLARLSSLFPPTEERP